MESAVGVILVISSQIQGLLNASNVKQDLSKPVQAKMHVNHACPEVIATPQTPSMGVSHLAHRELTTTRSAISQPKHALNVLEGLTVWQRGAIAVMCAQRARLEALLTRKAKQNANFAREVASNSTRIEPHVRYVHQEVTLIEKDRQIANSVRTV